MKDKVMLLLYEWKHIFDSRQSGFFFSVFFNRRLCYFYSGNALTNKKLKAIDEAKKESVKDYHNTFEGF